MGAIKVSVVIPCFNDGQYLEQAIGSVQLGVNTQTEIIVVDDGSDDPLTQTVLKRVQGERVHVYHQENKGPSEARNEGIRRAQGTYILPLDADDAIEADYIPRALRVLEREAEVGVVYCHADLFGKAAGKWKLPDYSFERMLLENIVFVSAMFRKSDWQAVGGFKSTLKFGLEDYDFFIGILEMGKNIYQIPEILFHYRIKKRSRTTALVADKNAVKDAYEMIRQQHAEFYRVHGQTYIRVLRDALIDQQYKLRWLRNAKESLQRRLSRLLYFFSK